MKEFKYFDNISQENQFITKNTIIYLVKLSDGTYRLNAIDNDDIDKIHQDTITRAKDYYQLVLDDNRLSDQKLSSLLFNDQGFLVDNPLSQEDFNFVKQLVEVKKKSFKQDIVNAIHEQYQEHFDSTFPMSRCQAIADQLNIRLDKDINEMISELNRQHSELSSDQFNELLLALEYFLSIERYPGLEGYVDFDDIFINEEIFQEIFTNPNELPQLYLALAILKCNNLLSYYMGEVLDTNDVGRLNHAINISYYKYLGELYNEKLTNFDEKHPQQSESFFQLLGTLVTGGKTFDTLDSFLDIIQNPPKVKLTDQMYNQLLNKHDTLKSVNTVLQLLSDNELSYGELFNQGNVEKIFNFLDKCHEIAFALTCNDKYTQEGFGQIFNNAIIFSPPALFSSNQIESFSSESETDYNK
ncbi:hypothetical protein L3V83_14795 [Thiotrichales bacterium 19X7-9]|nr:hypothetical protein [Thiotrichales bacterium 19X7-9]